MKEGVRRQEPGVRMEEGGENVIARGVGKIRRSQETGVRMAGRKEENVIARGVGNTLKSMS